MNQPHHQPDDFMQLRGAFDSPIAPSPSFAGKLREQIELELSAGDRVVADRGANVPLRLQASTSRVQTLTANGWQGALMTAAAIAVVLAMVFGALRLTTDRRGNDNSNNSIPSNEIESPTNHTGQGNAATPGATHGNTANWAGDTGKTWTLDHPGLSEDPVVEEGPPFASMAFVSEIAGDFLVEYGGLTQDFRDGLRVTNLETRAPLWSLPFVMSPAFAIYDDYILILRPDKTLDNQPDASGNTNVQLVALSIDSGEELWASEKFGLWSLNNESWGPVIDNEIAYVSDARGDTFAFDVVTGATVWSNTEPGQRDIPGETPDGGSVVVGTQSVYVAGPEYNVFEFDKATGELVNELTLVNEQKSDRDVVTVTLQLRGNALIAVARVPQGIGTPVSLMSYGPQTLVYGIEPSGLTLLWSKTLDVVAGNTALTTESLFIPVLDEQGDLVVHSYDPASGALKSTFDVFSPGSTNIRLMVAGSSLFVATYQGQLHVVDLQTGSIFKPGELLTGIADDYASIPLGVWNGNLVFQFGIVKNEGDSPATPDTSTSEATPDAADG
jgi:outer membrane protein assembly factor BamB